MAAPTKPASLTIEQRPDHDAAETEGSRCWPCVTGHVRGGALAVGVLPRPSAQEAASQTEKTSPREVRFLPSYGGGEAGWVPVQLGASAG